MPDPTRRTVLAGAAAVAATAAFPKTLPAAEGAPVLKGNVNHSVVFWCFNVAGEKWGAEKTCQVAKSLGCKSVELIGPEHWPMLQKHGLTCAIAPNGTPAEPFKYGFNNTALHAELLARTTDMIGKAAEAKVPSVIGFFGYRWKNPNDPKSGEITRDEAVKNCVTGLKELARTAEKHGVTVNVEHLNSRDTTNPMKGHPGYQGDDLEFCAEILRKVGSDRVKLLFDIYHVQIMHGDLIRRLDECKDILGHVHTAGNPGRGELDDVQEINYPAVLKKLVSLKYTGYVGHEFIPTRDPLAGLTQAVRTCDV
ncbi:MAG: hydroxypyruvate isomerase family protein [Fimbriiglobus sp.]